MRLRLSLILLCFLSAQVAVVAAPQANTTIFYVATNGNDGNAGTREAPFLTPQRARDAVRALPSSAFQDQDVYVLLRGGTYRLQQPLELTAIDSGRGGRDVVYRSYPNETAIISGAIPVTGWASFSIPLGMYRAAVDPVRSRQLYVNGARAQRAQTTPYPAGFLPSFANGGIEFLITGLNPAAWRDPSGWLNPQDVEAVIITQWKMMRVPLSSVIAFNPGTGTGLLTMQEPAWTNANIYYDPATNQPGIWSFWQVTRFENTLQFLTEPGQWYLDAVGHFLYYIPLPDENIFTSDVELPILETLISGHGALGDPIHNIRFEGLTFTYATWLGPSSSNGYVSDQAGMLLLGSGHPPTFIGHDPDVVPTPGNIQFSYAHNIVFSGNIFQHLGAAALQFNTGSQNNTIDSNLFTDISGAAIELGAVAAVDHHPSTGGQVVKNNTITNNLISDIGVDYVDAPGILCGFTRKTTIRHNTIMNVPWSGISMGWGWGLLDKDSFPGLPHAVSGQWGTFTTMTPNAESVIAQNKFYSFLNVLWDGGAIYTQGRQGPSKSQGLLIKENVAYGKRPAGGGNTYYTDGGSRCIRLERNVSYRNAIGITYFGPPSQVGDPLPYPPYSLGNNVPYGSDIGGCVTFGDIRFTDNYILEGSLPAAFVAYNLVNYTLLGTPPYSADGFFDVCPFSFGSTKYPKDLSFQSNHPGFSLTQVPTDILSNAGVQERPSTIPADQWILPPP